MKTLLMINIMTLASLSASWAKCSTQATYLSLRNESLALVSLLIRILYRTMESDKYISGGLMPYLSMVLKRCKWSKETP